MDIEEIKHKITKGGLKFTHQRMVIYEELTGSQNHPTAEWVYEQVREKNPSISLGTVYKTLDTFVNAGIIQKFVDNNGVMRFDAILEAHSHLYDKETNEIRDYRNKDLESLLKKFFDNNEIKDFEVEDISVVIKGRNK
ncbi:transcriptional repressor [Echinicola jeungdonensis]|uniref:Fur family transcriptional regulator n=1 Tax=Echinicola jeungdonensis TaxID=709343 RepID=A0ABV5J3F4_9BACT|nr:transcriptional repressor [Echinicola jeungdonensis]MDN3669610.1 transcriptional repressor [Echinicola jeungdonensis]